MVVEYADGIKVQVVLRKNRVDKSLEEDGAQKLLIESLREHGECTVAAMVQRLPCYRSGEAPTTSFVAIIIADCADFPPRDSVSAGERRVADNNVIFVQGDHNLMVLKSRILPLHRS